jgi:hypothetical protein
MNTRDKITGKCNELKEPLLKKNEAYGDAALQPLNIFSSANAEYGLRQRIDDKLKRIQNVGLNDSTEDTLIDLAGYLILLMISRDDKQNHNIQRHQGHQRAQSYYTPASTSQSTGGQVEGLDFED